MKKILLLLGAVMACASMSAQVTIEECVSLANDNYPLISKYGLIDAVRDVTLSDIDKSWLPQVTVYGQATVQNAVPSFPEALSDMMSKLGNDLSGMSNFQYKAGVDINQTIWDGDASKNRREAARASAAQEKAAMDVQLYAVRERVENLYFGILLIEEQMKQVKNTLALLEANVKHLTSMKANGVAMQSDVDMLQAQCLTTKQQLVQAENTTKSYRKLLGLYVGRDMSAQQLVMPAAMMPGDQSTNRPELKLFDASLYSNSLTERNVKSSLMPRIGFFAQAYYGYPGYDYFKSIMERTATFNVIAGVRASWDVGAFYTKKNSLHKMPLKAQEIDNDREVFLFNNSLQAQSASDRIDELRAVMADDDEVVQLRTNVRKAAESQLSKGVIDATALLSKITDENQARLTAAYHQVQLVQSIYQLKYTLNR